MEAGTTIITTEEYMELRAMKDNLEARKAEIEASADKVAWECVWRGPWGQVTRSEYRFKGRDEVLSHLQSEIDRLDPAKISRTLPARLHFLFTGNLTQVKE